MHGVTDAPAVDIYANGGLLVENLAYGDFQGYLQVPVGDYTLDITAMVIQIPSHHLVHHYPPLVV